MVSSLQETERSSLGSSRAERPFQKVAPQLHSRRAPAAQATCGELHCCSPMDDESKSSNEIGT